MDLLVGPLRKRHKIHHIWDESSRQNQVLVDERLFQAEDIWENGSLLALKPSRAPGVAHDGDAIHHRRIGRGKKRGHSFLTASDGPDETLALETSSSPQTQEWLYNHFPEIFPSLPSKEDRHVDLAIPNPFVQDCRVRYPSLGRAKIVLPEDGAVNGYVKVRFWKSENGAATVTASKGSAFGQRAMAVHHRSSPDLPGSNANIPSLPPDFGRGFKLNNLDSMLLKFYLVAFCNGRTLLPRTNFWRVDIARMAAGNACVRHAMLSFAAAYVLDYAPTETLRRGANYHYEMAVYLLNQALRDPGTQEIGKGDSAVGALILLLSDDIVNWELRRAKGCEQRWRAGSRVAKTILLNSDPAYRYRKLDNVQSNSARISNANWIAYVDISAQPVTPLKIEDIDRAYSWLLTGSEREGREIHGATGVCPKILHIFAQITHLTALMAETPDSMIIPHGAEELGRRLVNFRQWSELSEGYETQQELLDSCELNSDGKVDCPAKVTELTAETWVAAAQIYLQCRFFRKSRSAEVVLRNLDVLLRCIERMPTSGPLFTSQSPLPTIVLAGLVSYRDEDRQVVRDWFHTVGADAGCRSSVPPVWKALQGMWQWINTGLVEGPDGDDIPISGKRPWWEDMVAKLTEDYGELNLA